MKNKKELLKIQYGTIKLLHSKIEALNTRIEELSVTVAVRNNEIVHLKNANEYLHKDITALNALRNISETSLTSAEKALKYKELRENDNAEFIAKVITGIVSGLTI